MPKKARKVDAYKLDLNYYDLFYLKPKKSQK